VSNRGVADRNDQVEAWPRPLTRVARHRGRNGTSGRWIAAILDGWLNTLQARSTALGSDLARVGDLELWNVERARPNGLPAALAP
jgi:hypothetical protein